MPSIEAKSGDIAARGDVIYEERIRPLVDPEFNGQLVVINVDTGEYLVDADDVAATLRARERFGIGAPLYERRVGRPYVYKFGGGPLRSD